MQSMLDYSATSMTVNLESKLTWPTWDLCAQSLVNDALKTMRANTENTAVAIHF